MAGLRGRAGEFLVFVIFGAVNTGITYIIYVVCLAFMSYRMAYSFTYLCGIIISYCLNARFVFKEKLRLVKALQYPIVYVMQYFVGLVFLYLLVEVAHLNKYYAPLLIIFVTVPFNYVLSRHVIKGWSRS